MNKEKIIVLDSTLRDGAQAEGISFSVEDKLNILNALDQAGIDIIEAGFPGSNPKDIEFFEKLKDVELENAKICAFGSTRRPNIKAEDDDNLNKIIESGAKIATIFGKSSEFHTEKIIHTTKDENLNMIEDSVRYLTDHGLDVIYDAEHFFDGYKENPDYALQTLKAAQDGGAVSIALCDTNGGSLPSEIEEIITKIQEVITIPLGIHAHNDSGLAVANTLSAVRAGARQVQGTFLGFGERCGNANLSTIIPNLQLKMNFNCVGDEKLKKLTNTSIKLAEIANYSLQGREPFIGKSAFAHKGGMHIDAVLKDPKSFEHVVPDSIGNERRLLMSEVSGRGTIINKINEIDPSIDKTSEETTRLMDKIKELEYEGYQFEGAEGSIMLLIRRELGAYKPFFILEDYKTIGSKVTNNNIIGASAIVKVNVNGKTSINAAEGDGPVNALDIALREALKEFYPNIDEMKLTDFKVRVIDKGATASKVRVLIESSDGEKIWSTVGVSSDIIEASLIALIDSIEYKLLSDMEKQMREYRLIM